MNKTYRVAYAFISTRKKPKFRNALILKSVRGDVGNEMLCIKGVYTTGGGKGRGWYFSRKLVNYTADGHIKTNPSLRNL